MSSIEGEHWITMFPGIRRRTLASGANMMQMIVTLDAGALLPEHKHPHEQMCHVFRGRLRFVIGGVEQDVGPGQSVLMPSNTLHSAEALEDSLVIDTFSPPREDLLAEDRRVQSE